MRQYVVERLNSVVIYVICGPDSESLIWASNKGNSCNKLNQCLILISGYFIYSKYFLSSIYDLNWDYGANLNITVHNLSTVLAKRK